MDLTWPPAPDPKPAIKEKLGIKEFLGIMRDRSA